jgi:phospholipase/carboxylesterase
MSYSMGLSATRPQPAGLLIFSGFIPTVDGWEADLSRSSMPVFIAHGRQDPVMSVEFARTARSTLEGAGFPVEYHESDAAHFIDPNHVPGAVNWLSEQL